MNFISTHKEYTKKLKIFEKVIHLYRNPLDFIVSLWFYWYIFRGNSNIDVSQCLRMHLDMFLRKYVSYRRNERALMLSYEYNQRNPEEALKKILLYIHPTIKVNYDFIVKSATFSKKEYVSKQEDLSGPIHSPKGYKGKFVRDGSIGQWENYFSIDDIYFCKTKLKEYGVEWSEFIFK